MYITTIKLESEQELIDLRHLAAKVLGIDVTHTDNSMVARAGLQLLSAYLSALEKNVEPGKMETFKICFASKKGWFKNYNWKQSKEQAAREKSGKQIFDEMMRILHEAADITIQKQEEVQSV